MWNAKKDINFQGNEKKKTEKSKKKGRKTENTGRKTKKCTNISLILNIFYWFEDTTSL